MSILLAAQSTETVASKTGPWAAAILLIGLGTFVIIANWVYVWNTYRRGKYMSTVPFIGGGLAAIGVVMIPAASIRQWWWVAPIIDIGCWTGVACLPFLLKELIASFFHRSPVSYSRVMNSLQRNGWFVDRGDGRLIQYRHKRKRGTVTIIQAGHVIRAIPPGVKRSILRQAGLDKPKRGA